MEASSPGLAGASGFTLADAVDALAATTPAKRPASQSDGACKPCSIP
jgi:hypothetical protein